MNVYVCLSFNSEGQYRIITPTHFQIPMQFDYKRAAISLKVNRSEGYRLLFPVLGTRRRRR